MASDDAFLRAVQEAHASIMAVVTAAAAAAPPSDELSPQAASALRSIISHVSALKERCLPNEAEDKKEQLHQKNVELVDYFQNAPVALHWLNADGVIMWANNTEMAMFGYDADEYIGQPIGKFIFADDASVAAAVLDTLRRGSSVEAAPMRMCAKDGRLVPILLDSNVNFTKAGGRGGVRLYHTSRQI